MASRAEEEAHESDRAWKVAAAEHARASALLEEMRRPADFRLTDWQRATLETLAAKLARVIFDALWARIGEAPTTWILRSCPSVKGSVFLLLENAGFAGDLLFRVEALRRRARGVLPDMLMSLTEGAHSSVAVAAASVMRSRDCPNDSLRNLPSPVRRDVVWSMAGALRARLVQRGEPPGKVDALLSDAAADFLASLDDGSGSDARAEWLVETLHCAGQLTTAFIADCARRGEWALIAMALARLCALPASAARELMFAEQGEAMPLLLRGAGLERDGALAVLTACYEGAPLHGAETDLLIEQAAHFDALTAGAAAEALSFWRTHPAYRQGALAPSGGR